MEYYVVSERIFKYSLAVKGKIPSTILLKRNASKVTLLNNLLRDQSMESRFAAVNKSALILDYQRMKGVIMSENINYRRNKELAIYIKECEGISKAALSRIDNIDRYAFQMINESFVSVFNAIKRLYEEIEKTDFPDNMEF